MKIDGSSSSVKAVYESTRRDMARQADSLVERVRDDNRKSSGSERTSSAKGKGGRLDIKV